MFWVGLTIGLLPSIPLFLFVRWWFGRLGETPGMK